MDVMVSARVPVAAKEQAGLILKDIGASQSELIQAAFEYVVKTGRLPQVDDAPGICRIVLTPEQAEEVRARSQRAHCDVPSSFWKNEASNVDATSA